MSEPYTPTTEDIRAAYENRAVIGPPAMAADYEEAEAQFDRWLASLSAPIREMHFRWNRGGGDVVCGHCNDYTEPVSKQPWPCPTMQAVLRRGMGASEAGVAVQGRERRMSDFADRARAEAERRWPGPNIVMPSGWHEKGMASGFVLGALWAAEQEPSDAEVEASTLLDHDLDHRDRPGDHRG